MSEHAILMLRLLIATIYSRQCGLNKIIRAAFTSNKKTLAMWLTPRLIRIHPKPNIAGSGQNNHDHFRRPKPKPKFKAYINYYLLRTKHNNQHIRNRIVFNSHKYVSQNENIFCSAEHKSCQSQFMIWDMTLLPYQI